MKKLIKWIFIIFVLLAVLIFAGCYVFLNYYAKDVIEAQIEKQVNRDVQIGHLNLNIFSLEPVISMSDLIIANELLTDNTKQTDSKDHFVSVKTTHLNLKLKPLLSGQFELAALMIKSPDIRLIRYTDGSYNFSDLIEPCPPKTESSKTDKKVPPSESTPDKKESPESPPKKQKPSESKPDKQAPPETISADDIPFQIIVGELGIENGHVQLYDQTYKQIIHFNNIKTILHDININPKNLANENTIKFDASMNLKTEGKLKSGWAKSFDFDLIVNASVRPFDPKTHLLDPEATIQVGSPTGVISGLQIYESIRSVLMNFKITALDFLKKDLEWKKGIVKVIANQRVVQLNEGSFHMDEMIVDLDGKYLIQPKAVDLALNVLVSPEEQNKVEQAVRAFIEKQINHQARKYVSTEKIIENILNALTSDDGRMYLIFAVSGPMDQPKVKLVHPKLPAIDSIISSTMNKIKDQLAEQVRKKADEAKSKIQKEVDRVKEKYLKIPKDQNSILDDVKDNLLDKLPFSF